MTDARFYARSASDKTDDWPFWFVADSYQSGLNVVRPLLNVRGEILRPIKGGGLIATAFSLQPFLNDWDAVNLAMWANAILGTAPMAMWREISQRSVEERTHG